MKGFEPSLLEKLFDDVPRVPGGAGMFRSLTLEQYKESVARDLEGLLNSRAAFGEDGLEAWPECRRSLLTYGLRDFSTMSLANGHDRATICRSLEQAIARHEPRLHGVRVMLEGNGRGPSALRFAIHALLDVEPAREPVSFDALLQPSTMQYSVSRLRRSAAA
ncbi:type VI secretion system baseplate subunit TssE [Aerolutibacter ruishenii]|uniref:Type VI secretion system protein ImpF n=1 Tax=Aerolutibacter ruishenii TaxID=686800 RepID=A0A562M0B9_9GAMM|nr:type VI secretion system baseplate subunit TssE [Lysobacter ruishenii]TWI13385.1 type VI secretion system protein ImpF [Lysobacter ruishenii]